jgi:hypothetical protein
MRHLDSTTAGLALALNTSEIPQADGILDRLVHNARRIEMGGDSMCKRIVAARKSRMCSKRLANLARGAMMAIDWCR